MMEIIYNEDGSSCNCNFKWVVIQNGHTIFGANTREECEVYVSRYTL